MSTFGPNVLSHLERDCDLHQKTPKVNHLQGSRPLCKKCLLYILQRSINWFFRYLAYKNWLYAWQTQPSTQSASQLAVDNEEAACHGVKLQCATVLLGIGGVPFSL